jgi:hypothetical protein
MFQWMYGMAFHLYFPNLSSYVQLVLLFMPIGLHVIVAYVDIFQNCLKFEMNVVQRLLRNNIHANNNMVGVM